MFCFFYLNINSEGIVGNAKNQEKTKKKTKWLKEMEGQVKIRERYKIKLPLHY